MMELRTHRRKDCACQEWLRAAVRYGAFAAAGWVLLSGNDLSAQSAAQPFPTQPGSELFPAATNSPNPSSLFGSPVASPEQPAQAAAPAGRASLNSAPPQESGARPFPQIQSYSPGMPQIPAGPGMNLTRPDTAPRYGFQQSGGNGERAAATQAPPAQASPTQSPTAQAPVMRASATVETSPQDFAQPPRPVIERQLYTRVEDLRGQPIAAVRIEGNKSIATYAIERLITETRAGRPVISEQIRQDKATLINTRWFVSVRERIEMTEAGPVVTFQVIERPILRRVEFIGNKKFSAEKLSRETGLVEGHGFDVSANLESVTRIRQLYYDKGYVHAKVELTKGAHPDDREVVIVIDEGPKVSVSWISFEGNQFVSGPVLKTKLSTKTQWLLLFGGAYNPDSIQSDVATLKAYYEALGFFDVDVQARERASDDRERIHVTFLIKEGVRYRVRNIETSGNSVLSREQLLESLKLSPRDSFNSRFLAADTQAMKDKYDNLGRPFAQVQPRPVFLEEAGWLDLVYDIQEDDVLRIGRINIRITGDETHTKTAAIRHRINKVLKPGEIARAKDIQAAQAILRGDPIVDKEKPPSFNIRRLDGTDYMAPLEIARGQNHPSAFGTAPDRSNLVRTGLLQPNSGVEPLWPATDVSRLMNSSSAANPVAIPQSPVIQSPVAQPPATNLPARPASRLPPAVIEPHEATVPDAPRPTSYLSPMHRARRDSGEALAMHEPSAFSAWEGFEDEEPETQAIAIDPQLVFRAQSDPFLVAPPPGLRGQSIDPNGLPDPQNYLYGNSPQGDPFGNGLRGPGPAPGFVDVDIDVTEGRTGRLMFGAGINSDAGVVGSIILQEDSFDITAFPRSWQDITHGRAFRGGGQSFRLEAVPGTQVSRYNLSWRDPYIFGTDFSFGTDLFYYNRYFQNWTEDRAGGRLSLGYILNRYWSVGAALRLENVEFRDFTNSAFTPQLYTDVAGDNFLSTAQIKLAYDTRDSSFLPSKGHILELAYEQGFGEFNYPRVDISGSQYFTVYERADGTGKHILEFRGNTIWTGGDTPVFERLFAGGFQTFRGFEFRGVSPRQNNFRIGGEFMAVGTAEYIFPITAGDGLRGVVFTDFGTVDTEVELDEFRVTAGFGFRISVPAMGPAPIALDFAFPILSERQDEEQLFSFYMGASF